MKSKFYLQSIVIVLLAIVGVYLFSQQSPATESQRIYPKISSFDFYQINEIQQNNFTSGNFNTEGYVVKISTCPPCPKGAICKLCMNDNIVISENNQLLESYSLTEKEMIIFAENPKQFELGRNYRFSVKIIDYKSTAQPANDVELVGYDLI